MIQFLKNNDYLIFIYALTLTSLYGFWQVATGNVSLWWLTAALLWTRVLWVMGVGVSYHRYFTHKSFTATKFWQFIMAYFTFTVGVSKPLWGIYRHRAHHKYSDTAMDPQSTKAETPFRLISGLWYLRKSTQEEKYKVPMKDAINDPFVKFPTDHYFALWLILFLVTSAISWKVTMFLFIIPAVLNFYEINLWTVYVIHNAPRIGYRIFDLPDTSTNIPILKYWLFGEHLHHNHHKYPCSCDFAVRPDEFDLCNWIVLNIIKGKPITDK
jgi:stearoyl-CoA desaturase (delta-9 desaturase)